MELLPISVLMASEFICNIADDSDSSDSSSEEEVFVVIAVIKKRYKRKPSRIKNYLYTVANYTAKEFQQHFRITLEAYETLLGSVGPHLRRKRHRGRDTIDVEKQLLSVLWLLATPDSYRSVGDRFDMGKSSLSVSFMRVVEVLCGLASRIIKWPLGPRALETKENFQRKAGLPNVVGCVDGTFIDIKAPKEDPDSYITRKSRYSITLQGICDAELKFTDVFVGFPGSVNDNRIFRNSDIYQQIQEHLHEYCPQGEYILGDKAYPILSWCIPPYINRGNLRHSQIHFNTAVAQTRQTIERTFALLFGRFRRLKFLDMNRTDCIPATVLASCVMHNICLDSADLEIENYIQEGLNHVHHNIDNNNRPIQMQEEREGIQKRDDLCRQLWAARH